jgi:hypothetical protein
VVAWNSVGGRLIERQVVELAVKVSSSPVNVAMIVAFCALRVSAPGQRKGRTLAAHQREIQQPADCYSATGLRGRSMAGEVNTIGQLKRGGGDRSSLARD